MADITVDRAVAAPRQNLVKLTHVMYGLHAFSALMGILTPALIVTSFLSGWPSIIAVIINYVKRDEVRGTWLDSHFSWQLRTFWYALLWLFVIFLLFITLVGIPLAVVVGLGVGIWIVYRLVRGWMLLGQGKAVPIKK
ncbi:MAG: hypothetical protein JWO70_410 [Betaproteobacteria bacterium]|nr:hypothetical protein [Betaproteobacteria bacterium]